MLGRFADVEVLLSRQGSAVGPFFDASANEDGSISELLAETPILCVGAGGLGCEILKDLALSGFQTIHVIDMDTIDITNLNRQFLFRMEDVGKAKADVAAARVMERVAGCSVIAHVGRIEEKETDFYEQFPVIVLGLDSLEARRWMNNLACSFLEFSADGTPKPETIKPLIDGGTEGFKGHARVIYPGMTPCFDCLLWLFPPQVKFPLCTLAETPRSAAHCIEYAHLILWGKHHSEDFDSDNEAHMQWVFERARERAAEYNIQGVTLQVTQGVVKNIIPAIPSTNAVIAATCVLEAFKIVSSGCLASMDNYMMYTATEGVYTHTNKYERDEGCPVCGAGAALPVSPTSTLAELLDRLTTAATATALGLAAPLAAPSVSAGDVILYMRGPLEASYAGNAKRLLSELLPAGSMEPGGVVAMVVTDASQERPLKVRLLVDGCAMDAS